MNSINQATQMGVTLMSVTSVLIILVWIVDNIKGWKLGESSTVPNIYRLLGIMFGVGVLLVLSGRL